MKVEGEHTVAAPRERVWTLLRVSCDSAHSWLAHRGRHAYWTDSLDGRAEEFRALHGLVCCRTGG